MSDLNLNVETMDLVEAYDWLESRGIQHSLDSLPEMKELIRSTLRSPTFKGKQHLHLRENMREALTHALSLKKDMNKDLAVIYSALMDKLNGLPTDATNALKAAFGDVCLKLSEYKDVLLRMNCVIVVAGETSAGKSSFLNLMLEDDVLPFEHMPTTSVICRIHPIPPGAERYFEIDIRGNIPRKYIIKECNKQSMLLKLSRKITNRSRKYDNAIVDIYWQIPSLGENYHVTIVDTPGVGESNSMSEKLFKYLQNAAAFIYIINSANAGGVQKDKLGLIFQKMYEIEEKDDMFSIDSNCMMFVCNKWDIVLQNADRSPKAEQQVLNLIINQLQKYTRKERIQSDINLFKMSTTEARRYLDNKIGYSKFYQWVLDGLGKLIIGGQAENSKRQFRFLESRIKHIVMYCESRRNQAGIDRQTQEMKRRLAQEKLDSLRKNTQQVKEQIRFFCKHQCENIAEAFRNYIHSLKQEIAQKIEQFIKSHTYDEYDVLRKEVKNQIQKCVCESLTDDIGAITMAKKAIEMEFTKQFCMLEKELQDVILDIRCKRDDTSFLSGPETTSTGTETDFSFTIGQKVALGLTAPIWIPIGLAVGLVGLVVAIPATAVSIFIDRKKLEGIYKNPSREINILLEETLDECFHIGAIRKMVDQRIMVQFGRRIDTVFDHSIPGMIKSQEILLRSIASDTRSAEHIRKVFDQSISNMNSVEMKLNDFKAIYKAYLS